MPELPEVQTIVNELSKKIIGLKITDVWADWPKTVEQAGGLKNLKKETKNKKILSVRRRAKYIIIDIQGDKAIFIHQKISGHLLYGRWAKKSQILNSKSETPAGRQAEIQIQNSKQKWISIQPGPLKYDRENQYIRVIFFLNNGYQLALSDLRRFGKVILVKDNDVSNLKEIRNLGPEPLEIIKKEFKKLFTNKRGAIKQVLLDPFFIVGIGNIYGDEILWDTGIHPLSRVEELGDEELDRIYNSIIKILTKAIKLKGSSIDDYRLPSGKKGEFQNLHKAYQRTGKNCTRRDGGIIKRIKIGARSAHFCPEHQKLFK